MKNQPHPFRWLAVAAASLFVCAGIHAAQFAIATNGIKNAFPSIAFDGTNYLVSLQIVRIDGTTEPRAQLISPSGTLIGSQITTGKTGDPPLVSFDGTNYLLAWADYSNSGAGYTNVPVFAQLISKSGITVGGPFQVSQSATVEQLDAIAFGGTNYLVVWSDKRRAGSGPGDKDIYARRVSTSGTPLGGDFKISGAAGNESALAFDETNFLVIWRDDVNDTDIYGRLVSPTGVFVTAEFVIDANSFPSDNPSAVIFDGTKYVVAINDEVGGQGTETWDLFGRFVTPAGIVLTNRFTISASSGAQRFPRLAFDGVNYLITWNDGLNSTNVASSTVTCKARFFDTNGMPASSEFNLFEAQGSKNPFFGPVLFNGKDFVAVTGLGDFLTNGTGGFAGATNGVIYGNFIRPLPRGAFPIAITSSNDFSFSAAFDGTNYLAGISGLFEVTSRYVNQDEITAQLISGNGALIGSRIRTGRFGGSAQVAFDGTNHLMVWNDATNSPNSDIYGQRISRAGGLVGSPFAISAASGKQALDTLNQLVFDGSNYLVVWRDERNGTANTDIYGQLVKPDGTLLGAEIPISTDPESQTGASVSFDGTNFLIVWESRRSGSPELYDTYGKFVSRAGVPGTALLISQAPSPRWNPTSVAFDGTNYLAVWNRDTSAGNPTPSDWDIYARLVSRSGTFVGNEFPITTAPGSQPFYGGVIYDGSAYVVSWIDEPTSSLKHRFFNRSGVPLGSEFSLFGSQGTRIPLGGFFLGGSQPLVLASFVDSSFSNGDVYGLLLPQHRLDVTAPFANGNFQLRLTGVPGLTYALQSTTNLFATNTVWTTLTASNTLGGTFNFTHTNAASSSRRFYRSVLP